jgi:hypothetical protein
MSITTEKESTTSSDQKRITITEFFNIYWTNALNQGYIVQRDQIDGLAFWQTFRKKHENLHVELIQVNPDFVQFANTLNYKTYPLLNGCDDQVKVEICGETFINSQLPDHFLIQHFRILRMCDYKPPPIKILQLAYNIGQWKMIRERRRYNKKVDDFYQLHHLDKISTFFII